MYYQVIILLEYHITIGGQNVIIWGSKYDRPVSFWDHLEVILASSGGHFGGILGSVWNHSIFKNLRNSRVQTTESSEIVTLFKTVSRPEIGFQNFRKQKLSNKTVSQTVSRAYVVERFGTLFCHEWGVLEVSWALVDTFLIRTNEIYNLGVVPEPPELKK